MGIAEDLTDIKADLAVLKAAADDAKKWREGLDAFIDGNGGNGLKVRVDRLEQQEARRVWVDRAIFIGIVGLLLQVIFG